MWAIERFHFQSRIPVDTRPYRKWNDYLMVKFDAGWCSFTSKGNICYSPGQGSRQRLILTPCKARPSSMHLWGYSLGGKEVFSSLQCAKFHFSSQPQTGWRPLGKWHGLISSLHLKLCPQLLPSPVKETLEDSEENSVSRWVKWNAKR